MSHIENKVKVFFYKTFLLAGSHTIPYHSCWLESNPVQVGLRLLETFRERVREAITEDPILPVAQHYERELAEIKVCQPLLG